VLRPTEAGETRELREATQALVDEVMRLRGPDVSVMAVLDAPMTDALVRARAALTIGEVPSGVTAEPDEGFTSVLLSDSLLKRLMDRCPFASWPESAIGMLVDGAVPVDGETAPRWTLTDFEERRIAVGSRVRAHEDAAAVGTVIDLGEWDGDADDEGRSRALAPYVRVRFEDGREESFETCEWEFMRGEPVSGKVELLDVISASSAPVDGETRERIIAAGLMFSGRFDDAKRPEVRELAATIATALDHPECFPWAMVPALPAALASTKGDDDGPSAV
jgi:hypothetical protein